MPTPAITLEVLTLSDPVPGLLENHWYGKRGQVRRAGNVDYRKVVELKGVDLELYRGKAREAMRVSVAT